jgi:hypothetical protein
MKALRNANFTASQPAVLYFGAKYILFIFIPTPSSKP